MSTLNIQRGRDAECAALDVLLDAARRGESRALVICGEPGVGKTALLDYAIGSAPDVLMDLVREIDRVRRVLPVVKERG